MKSELEQIYKTLKKDLTSQKLGIISAKIISSYKNQNYEQLKIYAYQNELPYKREDAAKIFARLINLYHPDKLAGILQEIEQAYIKADLSSLRRIKAVYAQAPLELPLQIDYYEDYGLSEEDYEKFGMRIAQHFSIRVPGNVFSLMRY